MARKYSHKVHLHVDNTSELGHVFEVTRARMKGALNRRPGMEKQVRVTIGYDGSDLDSQLKTADVLFGWNLDRENLSQRAPRLRWIHAHGAGVNHLMPLDWLPKGAVLTNSRGVHGQRATEYASMAIMMLNNRVPEMVTNQRKRRWVQCYNTSLEGKRLLIIGVGHIGGDVARWAKSVGLHVMGVRRSGRPHRYVDEMHRPGALKKLLPRADFVLMTAPHTSDTHHLLGSRELALMKRGSGLVNYSRADLVDYDALCKRLERGELSAIVDVLNPEPHPRSSPLWNTPNLIITPHSSSADEEAYTPRTLDLVFRNMERFIAGKPLLNRVSPKLQY